MVSITGVLSHFGADMAELHDFIHAKTNSGGHCVVRVKDMSMKVANGAAQVVPMLRITVERFPQVRHHDPPSYRSLMTVV